MSTVRFFRQRRFLGGAVAILIAFLVGAQNHAFAHNASPDSLFEALRGGGHVVYFRHAATTRSGVDRIEWPRERQRLLSAEGIQDSEDIGAASQLLALPIGEVIASPFARCRDMAEIAFGQVEERFELLGLLSDDSGRAERIAYLRDRMSTPTGEAGNRIIVSHRSNIREVAGVSLGEGDAVVVKPLGDGDFRILGTLRPADWRAVVD
ncbi:MAG: histidine phosphatase family protein [Pseudomonadota bacterium]